MKNLIIKQSVALGLAALFQAGLVNAQGFSSDFLNFDQPSVRAASQVSDQGLHQPLRRNLASLEAGQFLLDSIQIQDERARTPDFEAMADAAFHESEGAAVMDGQAHGGKLASVWND